MIFGTISMPIFTVWQSLFRQDNPGIKLLRVLHQVAAEIRNGQSRALALSEQSIKQFLIQFGKFLLKKRRPVFLLAFRKVEYRTSA